MSNKKRIYLSPPSVDTDEERLVVEALRSGWVAPLGPKVEAFQEDLLTVFQYNHVLALNSGTAALHLAIRLCEIFHGDKVLIGTFTFVAAANAVLYEGGIPAFIDSEGLTWNLDPDLLEGRLNKAQVSGEVIKAVIVTHIYGRPAQIQRIKEICKQYDVKLIEDAAEAVGSLINKKYAGSFGDFSILSFNGNKIITTSGGGALICKNAYDYKRALYLAGQAKENASHYQHSEVGYNYRLSNILAGIGVSQLEKLPLFITRKAEIYSYYKSCIGEWGIFDFPEIPKGYTSNNWLSVWLIKEEFISIISPILIVNAFEEENIEVRRFWKPLHLQPLFEKCEFMGNGISEDMFERGFCLPSGVELTLHDQERILEVLKLLLTSRGLLK